MLAGPLIGIIVLLCVAVIWAWVYFLNQWLEYCDFQKGSFITACVLTLSVAGLITWASISDAYGDQVEVECAAIEMRTTVQNTQAQIAIFDNYMYNVTLREHTIVPEGSVMKRTREIAQWSVGLYWNASDWDYELLIPSE